MAYELIWHEDSVKDLKKIDRETAGRIIHKVKSYLIQNPVELGTALKGRFKGLRRFRSGDYRIVYALDYMEEKVIILHVGHRKTVYKG